ncbi:MAG: cupin domain-containing protein [Gemmatimonadota bacterium]
MSKILARGALALSLCLLASPAAAQDAPAVFDAVFPEGRLTAALDSLMDAVELAPDENIRVVDLGRGEMSSHHLVFIRGDETPHTHDDRDLFAIVLRGSGAMLQGEDERPVGEGSIVFVPRGTVHAFLNRGDEPAVAFVIFGAAPEQG